VHQKNNKEWTGTTTENRKNTSSKRESQRKTKKRKLGMRGNKGAQTGEKTGNIEKFWFTGTGACGLMNRENGPRGGKRDTSTKNTGTLESEKTYFVRCDEKTLAGFQGQQAGQVGSLTQLKQQFTGGKRKKYLGEKGGDGIRFALGRGKSKTQRRV